MLCLTEGKSYTSYKHSCYSFVLEFEIHVAQNVLHAVRSTSNMSQATWFSEVNQQSISVHQLSMFSSHYTNVIKQRSVCTPGVSIICTVLISVKLNVL